jgi:hypothetical protein
MLEPMKKCDYRYLNYGFPINMGLLLLLGVCVTSCLSRQDVIKPVNQEKGADCQPTLKMVTGHPLSARSGPMEVHVLAVLAGCRADLQKITSAEETALVSEIFQPFALEGGGVGDPMKSGAHLAKQINARLGENLVSDVLVYRTSWREHLPAN